MRIGRIDRLTWTLAALFLLLLTLPAAALAADQGSEHYTATAVGIRGPVGGQSFPVNIYISGETSDAELQELSNLYAEKGKIALRDRLSDIEKGRMGRADRVGVDVALVRRTQTDEGQKIILVAVRDQTFFEIRSASRSTEYPYVWVELTVDDEGRGSGEIIFPAQIRFSDDGQLEVKEFGLEFFRLANVRLR
ncbi:MAG TPA: hypothetical protein VLV83_19190 [Acidobacteriota bacterium]|nr:hypothetical protein [Acidobacteriota bacterium]